MMIITKRQYAIAFIDGNKPQAFEKTLYDILYGKLDYEWAYALNEEMDAVLDLKVGGTHIMFFNRDQIGSRGVIKRIL